MHDFQFSFSAFIMACLFRIIFYKHLFPEQRIDFKAVMLRKLKTENQPADMYKYLTARSAVPPSLS
ncbi:MAG: hypothetical protein CVV49_01650 [Spirochaetae bacterium HGW-Spirochaetae-5]|nr:MAG: hypothetical protein CVV49_01650 [Spirochaetae bacterium HGW-Spirochaetae-5]